MDETRQFRTRYPARAVALVAGATLVCIAEVAMMCVLLMPLIPLIPLFFAAIVGHGCLLAAAVDYANTHARIVPVARSHEKPHAGDSTAPHTGAPARA